MEKVSGLVEINILVFRSHYQNSLPGNRAEVRVDCGSEECGNGFAGSIAEVGICRFLESQYLGASQPPQGPQASRLPSDSPSDCLYNQRLRFRTRGFNRRLAALTRQRSLNDRGHTRASFSSDRPRPATQVAADKSTKSASADSEFSARRGTSCTWQARFRPPAIQDAGN